MTLERVLTTLSTIGNYTDEDIARYTPLAQHNLSVYGSDDLSDNDSERLCYFIAARTNYDIALVSAQSDGVQSFTAGDVKIQNRDTVSIARTILDDAQQRCADIVGDSGFCFRSV